MTRSIPGLRIPPQRPQTPQMRLHAYYRQRGLTAPSPDRLSPAQARRHRRKLNRARRQP